MFTQKTGLNYTYKYRESQKHMPRISALAGRPFDRTTAFRTVFFTFSFAA
jgi:hypothetical protein